MTLNSLEKNSIYKKEFLLEVKMMLEQAHDMLD
jgi:hypothetical protein